MSVAAKAKSSRVVRFLCLSVSLLVAAAGVTLNVKHERTDFTSYRSDEIEFAIRAMYVFIVFSGLLGCVGSIYGHTWRAAAFGIVAPLVPVFCGLTFAVLVTFAYRLSAPAYTELVTQGNSTPIYEPRLPPNFHYSPQPINGSPTP
jgi:hypothetical protein